MKTLWVMIALPSALALAATEHPTGNRTTPPTIDVIAPRGVPRGMTTELTVEGLNLAGTSRIHFDRPGITGRILRIKELPDLPEVRLGSNNTPSTIDLGPLPPRNQVTIELDVSPEADIGPVNFRLQNQLGTSPAGRILIEPYYGETPDREPNDTLENANEIFLPTVVVGQISRPGDVDTYKIQVKAGQQIVFFDGAQQLGSTLQPVVQIVGEDLAVLAEFGTDGHPAERFAYRFEKSGTYFIRVTDYQKGGRASHFYRLLMGEFPLVTHAFPLGVQRSKTAELSVGGPGLSETKASVELPSDDLPIVRVRPRLRNGASFTEIRLAVSDDPQLIAKGDNLTLAGAQRVQLPVAIHGRIPAPQNSLPAEHFYSFSLRKGQKIVLEVFAQRVGSELDSLVEVLDAKGAPVEIATARPVLELFTTLRDHDSVQRGIRLNSITGLVEGDYLMAGQEIMRIEALPLQPDADVIMESFGGQRMAYFGTSPEAHAIDRAIYKVHILPPGANPPPNGLPLTRLYARNDDGGPGYGKDSYLEFTAPSDGVYVARIRDVRGLGGENFAYQLSIHEPRPDFRLAVNPQNPNVPQGGSIPLTVTARRLDGFNGEITITVEDLPPGITATSGKILAGQVSTTLLLSASPDAKPQPARPLRVIGRAQIDGRMVARSLDPDDRLQLVALMPPPDVQMTAETREIVLEPGAKAEVRVKIARQNGFGGRVPVEVRNLPPRVRVPDVGLNGVLINEDETERVFHVEALPNAEPLEQPIYVAGKVETRSPLASSYAAPTPILLKIKPKTAVVSQAGSSSAPTGAGAPK
jgi:hypothetical protein